MHRTHAAQVPRQIRRIRPGGPQLLQGEEDRCAVGRDPLLASGAQRSGASRQYVVAAHSLRVGRHGSTKQDCRKEVYAPRTIFRTDCLFLWPESIYPASQGSPTERKSVTNSIGLRWHGADYNLLWSSLRKTVNRPPGLVDGGRVCWCDSPTQASSLLKCTQGDRR